MNLNYGYSMIPIPAGMNMGIGAHMSGAYGIGMGMMSGVGMIGGPGVNGVSAVALPLPSVLGAGIRFSPSHLTGHQMTATLATPGSPSLAPSFAHPAVSYAPIHTLN